MPEPSLRYELQLKNSITPFANRIFFQHDNGVLFALHPITCASERTCYINGFPNIKEWTSIMAMFPFNTIINFMEYYNQCLLLFTEKEVDRLLSAYQPTRNIFKFKKEMKILKQIPMEYHDFIIFKGIPVLLVLSLSKRLQPELLADLKDKLFASYIKKKTAKYIIEYLSEMHATHQIQLLHGMIAIHKSVDKDGLSYLNVRYLQLADQLRHPQLHARKKQVQQIIKTMQWNPKINFDFDPHFESIGFTLYAKIASKQDIKCLCHDLENSDYHEYLNKLLEYLQ